jgi:hypothetical protein
MNLFKRTDNHYLSAAITTQGDTGTPTIVRVSITRVRNDNRYKRVENPYLRATICNEGTLAASTNATIAPVSGEGDIAATVASNKDLVLVSEAEDSHIDIAVTDATEETVTLWISSAPVGGPVFDSFRLDITHADPE